MKKALTLMIMVFLVFASNACTKQKEVAERENEKTVLRLVTWKANVPEAWDEIFDIFRTEHPDIDLKIEIGPHSSTAFHDMLTQKLKNRSTDVDVFLMDVIWPPEFAAAGWALPLDDKFTPDERAKYLEGAILANSYKGRVYGVPLFVDSGMLYYRKDLLDKYGFSPPVTWSEMVQQAKTISQNETEQGRDIYGFSGQFKQYEGLVCDMMEYILSNGGYILEPETGKPVIDSPKAVEAVRFVRDKIIGAVAPRGVLTYQEPESLDLFVQGRAVFHRNWPYAWEKANDPEISKVAGNVGITTLPNFPGEQSYSTLGGWQIGISAYSQNDKAAWDLASFLSSERIQKLLALKAGRAPTRKALYEDAEILAAYPQFKQMRDVFQTAYPRPRTPLYPALSNVLQRYFSRVISNDSLDLATEAKKVNQEIIALMAIEAR